jgi:hypothetical protein
MSIAGGSVKLDDRTVDVEALPFSLVGAATSSYARRTDRIPLAGSAAKAMHPIKTPIAIKAELASQITLRRSGMLIVLNIKRLIIINSKKQRRRIASAQLPPIVLVCGAMPSKKRKFCRHGGQIGRNRGHNFVVFAAARRW